MTSDSRNFSGGEDTITDSLIQLTKGVGAVISGQKDLSNQLLSRLKEELDKLQIEYISEEMINLTQRTFLEGYYNWVNDYQGEPFYCLIAGCNEKKEIEVYFFSYPDFLPVEQLTGPSGICAIGSNEETRDLTIQNTLVYFNQLSRGCNLRMDEVNLHQAAMMLTFALDSAVKSQGDVDREGAVMVATVDENGFYLFPYSVENRMDSHHHH